MSHNRRHNHQGQGIEDRLRKFGAIVLNKNDKPRDLARAVADLLYQNEGLELHLEAFVP